MGESRLDSSGSALAPPRTAREILERGRKFLADKGIEEFRLDAELLVAHALKLNRLGLFMALERPVDSSEIDLARELLVRRGKGEPVAYLTGTREFYGRPFCVGSGCLIPRPETEHIVDEARRFARERLGRSVEQQDLALELSRTAQKSPERVDSSRTNGDQVRDSQAGFESEQPNAGASDEDREPSGVCFPMVLDLGTGSGCLAISLALELDNAQVTAIDSSSDALRWARKNAQELGAHVAFEQADAFEFLNQLAPHSLDLVVSNPPYVDPAQAAQLAREVRNYEPSEALFAPAGDLDHWARRLLQAVPRTLRPDGLLLIELGADQGRRMLDLAKEHAPSHSEVELIADLAGIERVFALRLAGGDKE